MSERRTEHSSASPELTDIANAAPLSFKKAKRGRRKSGPAGGSLNVNSLMDIMTILLVFLLLTITSDPLNIQQGKDLRLARMAGGCGFEHDQATGKAVPVCRDAYRPPEDSIPITITKKTIMVDKKAVVPVQCKIGGNVCTEEDIQRKFECDTARFDQRCDASETAHLNSMSFYIDKSYKEDGDEEKFLIQPLHKELGARVKEHRELLETLGETWKGAATIIADSDVPFRMIAEVIYTAGMSSLSDMRFAVLKTTIR